MKAQFTDGQITAMIMKQKAGKKTADVCRWHALPGRALQCKVPRGDHLGDVLQVDRSSVRCLSRQGDDADLRDAIKRVCTEEKLQVRRTGS